MTNAKAGHMVLAGLGPSVGEGSLGMCWSRTPLLFPWLPHFEALLPEPWVLPRLLLPRDEPSASRPEWARVTFRSISAPSSSAGESIGCCSVWLVDDYVWGSHGAPDSTRTAPCTPGTAPPYSGLLALEMLGSHALGVVGLATSSGAPIPSPGSSATFLAKTHVHGVKNNLPLCYCK